MDKLSLCKNFEKHKFSFLYFDTKEQATEYFKQTIKNKVITFGGSVTLEEISLYETLKNENDIHWHKITPGHYMQTPEVYITSANGITENGEIVNIDGRVNRVAGSIYGVSHVYVICGINKLCKTLDDAIFRAKNIAAPKNAQRLERKTPCAIHADKCYDCNSDERICSVLAVTMQKPMGMENYTVVLINENLGY